MGDRERLVRLSLGRKLSQRALGLACAPLKLRAVRAPSTDRDTVLIVEPFGMGDVISLEPLVSQLLAAGRRVVVCGKSAWRAALPASDRLDWVDADLPWTRYVGREKYRLASYQTAAFRDLVERLRAVAPRAVGLDVRGDVRSVLLLWSVGCHDVLSLSHYVGTDVTMPAHAATLVHSSSSQPRWRQNLAFLDALGLPYSEPARPPAWPGRRRADTAPARSVAFVPLAPWAGKLWPPDHWRALRAVLTSKGASTAVLCGPGQAADARSIFAADGATADAAVVECGNLDAWAEQLHAVRCVVSVNTGPMHLAAALGRQVVLLNGSSALPLWAPSGEHVRVVHHQAQLPCAPCHEVHDGRRCGFVCMDWITVDEVAARVLGALALVASTGTSGADS